MTISASICQLGTSKSWEPRLQCHWTAPARAKDLTLGRGDPQDWINSFDHTTHCTSVGKTAGVFKVQIALGLVVLQFVLYQCGHLVGSGICAIQERRFGAKGFGVAQHVAAMDLLSNILCSAESRVSVPGDLSIATAPSWDPFLRGEHGIPLDMVLPPACGGNDAWFLAFI